MDDGSVPIPAKVRKVKKTEASKGSASATGEHDSALNTAESDKPEEVKSSSEEILRLRQLHEQLQSGFSVKKRKRRRVDSDSDIVGIFEQEGGSAVAAADVELSEDVLQGLGDDDESDSGGYADDEQQEEFGVSAAVRWKIDKRKLSSKKMYVITSWVKTCNTYVLINIPFSC